VITLDLPSARRLAFMCARAQLVVTVLAALIAVAVAGPRAGWSAVVGGGASTLASIAMALLAFGRLAGTSAERMLLAFYVGEFAKIIVVILVLVLALALTRVNPVALVAAFAATFLVYWLVLARVLWAQRSRPGSDAKGSDGTVPREMVR
jgi:F0F1-type ATP synthase assembly protein I